MTDPIEVLVHHSLTSHDIDLVVSRDPTDATALQIHYNDQLLPTENDESLVVDYQNGQKVRLLLRDFADDDGAWTLQATPRTRESERSEWERDGELVVDECSRPAPGKDDVFIPVTITATTENATGTQTRQKTIHIKIKTADPQPNRDGLQ